MATDYVLRLFEKKLKNKAYKITAEDIVKAQTGLSIKLIYLEQRLNVLKDRQEMLDRIINEKSLYVDKEAP